MDSSIFMLTSFYCYTGEAKDSKVIFEKRLRDMPLDADHLHSGLWQGSAPPVGPAVRDAGFSALVLCAEEYQPRDTEFPGVKVIHAPNVDDPLLPPKRERLYRALQAASQIANFLEDGKNVLVTCRMGINRSSLVSALALHKFLGISGLDACELIKSKRVALTNPQFIKCLSKIPARVNRQILAGGPKAHVSLFRV